MRKEELLRLGEHLGLQVGKSMRKLDIQNSIVKHLVNIKVFDASVLSKYAVNFEMQYNLRKLKMEDRWRVRN